ncbi:MAG: hypothetical protein LBQ23_03680 [Puniceicoccales bacterium]|jgi:hypothetical protein|nr:hypothetical protein [Puniceicoccales bacterium]
MILWEMLPDLKSKNSKMPLTESISSSGKRILSNTFVRLPDEIEKLELTLGEHFDIPLKCDEAMVNKCLGLREF